MALTGDNVDEPEKMQGRAGEPERHPKSAYRLLHSMWQRAGEPETHDTHRLLAQGWGTRETFRVHTQAFTLNAAQEIWNQWNLFISTST